MLDPSHDLQHGDGCALAEDESSADQGHDSPKCKDNSGGEGGRNKRENVTVKKKLKVCL